MPQITATNETTSDTPTEAIRSVNCASENAGAHEIVVRTGGDLAQRLRQNPAEFQRPDWAFMPHPGWLSALEAGLGHTPYFLEAQHQNKSAGWLPLSLVSSRLFGRYLVSLPYLNSG
ncbi:MAG TPA: hypothetical protein VGJ15_13300, partial [Pirellulales bacterium]